MEYFRTISPKAALFGIAVSGCLFVLISVIKFLLQTRRPKNFPPGPPPRLGLGNLHQVPLNKPFLEFHEWSKKYGDIIGLKMGPKNFVILSNPTIMHETFVKRGIKYGGRPPASIAIQHILPPASQHLHILFSQYDQYLKRWRGATRHLLAPDAVVKQGELMSSIGDKLMHNLLLGQEDWKICIQKWALEMPLLSIAGRRLEDYGPGYAKWYLDNQHDWLDFLEPSNTPPVELCPWLVYLPSFLASWKVRAAGIRKAMGEMYFQTLKAAKKKMADGEDHRDTLYRHLLRQREQSDKSRAFSDSQLAFMGGGLLDAALDTTLATFEALFVCLIGHQDVMRRVTKEVDEVCGERMPNCGDVKTLPLLTACFMETLRWRSPTNMGLPHQLMEDDVLGGYTIPKGTTVIANIYSIHLREEEYHRPEEFIPDRFLKKTSASTPMYSFSIGRRNCPGEDFARTFIVTTAAKLLWSFHVSTQDEQRPDLTWKTGFTSGLVTSPRGFRPKLTPRGEEKVREVTMQFRQSEDYLAR